MERARRTDFLFAGAAVVPLILALNGQPGAAMLLFVPLLVAACLHGAWEDAPTGPEGDPKGDRPRFQRSVGVSLGTGLSRHPREAG